jgi:hypothetical protein
MTRTLLLPSEIDARIAKFNTVALLSPAEFHSLNNFRTAAGRVLRVVNSILLPSFRSLPRDLLKEVAAFQLPRD